MSLFARRPMFTRTVDLIHTAVFTHVLLLWTVWHYPDEPCVRGHLFLCATHVKGQVHCSEVMWRLHISVNMFVSSYRDIWCHKKIIINKKNNISFKWEGDWFIAGRDSFVEVKLSPKCNQGFICDWVKPSCKCIAMTKEALLRFTVVLFSGTFILNGSARGRDAMASKLY